ncbi:conserved Plasmodium protein, unknown function [Plasmodium chabaudi chabaudi]|uniref:Uncharacterized protein n=1 Tax=Plasmodium chabaudi chabaudi TaxID=31271 RepID=A0A1C6YPI7_PLACU|nr:conserved Plasmodium protein, unknown function [Plasmodium chabaudi chabaudi]
MRHNKNKDNTKDFGKKKKNKRRSLSLLIPNYENNIINNIKLADKIYKLTIANNSDESDNDTEESRQILKNEKKKKKNIPKNKTKNLNRRSISCDNYDTSDTNSVNDKKQSKNKFDININEIKTKYKNQNIKIIYDDDSTGKVILRERKNKTGKGRRQNKDKPEYKGSSRGIAKKGKEEEEDDEEEEEDEEEDEEEEDEEEEEEDDTSSEGYYTEQNENAKGRTRDVSKYNKVKNKGEIKKNIKNKRSKKKCITRIKSRTLSDSYFNEKRKKNIRKMKREKFRNKDIERRREQYEKEFSEPINRKSDNYINYENDHYSNKINERRRKDDTINIFEEDSKKYNNKFIDFKREQSLYKNYNIIKKEIDINFLLNMKDIILKMHLNIQNIKEAVKNKNEYVKNLLDTSYINIIENIKRNEIKKDNFYKQIFYDLFSLLNEFILVDDYTKQFFFSIESEVRRRCLNNIKNEFFNFINKYLKSGENKMNYNSKWINTGSIHDQHIFNQNNNMHIQESENKRNALYSSLSIYGSNNNKEQLAKDNAGNIIRLSNPNFMAGNCNSIGMMGGRNDSNYFLYNKSCKNEEDNFVKIDRTKDDLILKIRNSNLHSFQNDQEETNVEYLKKLLKSEKEKNFKLELEYDELKQKYTILKKKKKKDAEEEDNSDSASNNYSQSIDKKLYKQICESKSFIKLEEMKLEESSKNIAEENIKLLQKKEMNDQTKKDIENDIASIEVKKKEIETQNEEINKAKKEIEEELSALDKKKKDIEDENDMVEKKKQDIIHTNNMIDEKEKEINQLDTLLNEKNEKLEDLENEINKKVDGIKEIRKELSDKKVELEGVKNMLNEKIKEVQKLENMDNENRKSIIEKNESKLLKSGTELKNKDTIYYEKEGNMSFINNENSFDHNDQIKTNSMHIEQLKRESSNLFSNDIGNMKSEENIMTLKNEILEREKLISKREESFIEEKNNFVKELDELNILKDNIFNQMDIIKKQKEELNIKEEELNQREIYITQLIEKNNSLINKDMSQTNINMLTGLNKTNRNSQTGSQLDIHDIPGGEINQTSSNSPNLRMNEFESKNCIMNTCNNSDTTIISQSVNHNTSKNFMQMSKNSYISNDSYTKDKPIDNVKEITEMLNSSLKEVEKYKHLLKDRELTISSLKAEVEKNISKNYLYKSDTSIISQSMQDNSPQSLDGKNGFSELSQDSKIDELQNGKTKQGIHFLTSSNKIDEQVNAKNLIIKELISVYKEISTIKEEYSKTVLKKNEFIDGLLLKFFNDLQTNYKMKENYYQKEANKRNAIIREKDNQIKELKMALDDKKIKEISYKKLFLKMNQINDSYKLKNKRSLSTVELLKQNIKLLNQDALKKNEMTNKFKAEQ